VLLQTMKAGPELGPRGRFQRLEPVIRADFDLSSMTRLAVGSAWSHLSPDDQQRLKDAFARYTIATYAQNFDSWSGEKLEVTGVRQDPFGTIVESRIVKSDGEPVPMNYLMRDNNNKWQIADIYLTGTISQLANLRSQFSAILARAGVSGLIASLNSKADMLVASAAAPR
jgi:phospholipid transport system substrate-binding protein